MTESIGVFMNVALLSGVAIAMPYVAFEFWLFAAPGLRPRERLFGLVGIPLAAIFFIGGIAFTYYVLLPSALPFLLNFLGIKAQLRPTSYFSFITGLMFWIGVAFEFPLVIYVLTAIGFVKPQVLAKQWRIAVVIIAIVAAAITPTVDPVNMGLVMLPMIGLYFISIGLSFIAYGGRSHPQKKKPLRRDPNEIQNPQACFCSRLPCGCQQPGLHFFLIPTPNHPSYLHPITCSGHAHCNTAAKSPDRF